MGTRRVLSNQTVQVLAAIALGVLIGVARPDWGVALKPLADGFIKLVKLVVAPVIFLTIVGGIAGVGDVRKTGRVGLKALVYFEVVSTLALGIGLVVANVVRPGAGVDVSRVQHAPGATQDVTAYTGASHGTTEFLLGVIPEGVLAPFVKGEPLQVLFLGVLVGAALAMMGPKGGWAVEAVHRCTAVMFRVVAIIMRVAPLGALGAMAYAIGKYGVESLASMARLMGCVYLTMLLFIVGVLGAILWWCGVSLWKYLRLIRSEILLVVGTSSSESALPRMIEKMQRAGCGEQTVGLVIPAGYSFNLDGTSIYLSMAVLFLAQAHQVHMGLGEQLSVLGLLMLTSKGAAAVTGGGFVVLAATLGATGNLKPEWLALLLGVDRFMSEGRAVTNLIGNGVAAIAVSKWEGEFERGRFEGAVEEERGMRSAERGPESRGM